VIRIRVGNVLRRFDSYRGELPQAVFREAFFRLTGRFVGEVFSDSEGLKFRIPTYDRGMGLMTFAAGPPERKTFRIARAMLNEHFGSGWELGDSTFLEIGANIGTATAVALNEAGFADAICFEPLPDNYRLLIENLAINGLTERVRAFEIALSDKEGIAEFEVSPDNSGDGRVRVAPSSNANGDAFREHERQVVPIKLTSFDAVCQDEAIDLERCGLAWIDAQGHEGHILQGAQSLLESDIPIVTEFWPYGLKRAEGSQTFIEAVKDNFSTVIDLGGRTPLEMSAKTIDVLFKEYEAGSFFDPTGATSSTDLVLLK
jgi:FkbM family methyltransferase